MTAREPGPVETGLNAGIAAATWLESAEFEPAKALARHLARKMDVWEDVFDAAEAWSAEHEGHAPKVPTHDNTTPGTYSRLLDSLGLTVTSKGRLGKAAGPDAVPKTKTEARTDDDSDSGADDSPLALITALRAGVRPS